MEWEVESRKGETVTGERYLNDCCYLEAGRDGS